MTFNCEGVVLPPVIIHNKDFPDDAKKFYNKQKTYKETSDGLMDRKVLKEVLEDLDR